LRFFFQAEDGIRDFHVTGVQTCALPISSDTATLQEYVSLIPEHLVRRFIDKEQDAVVVAGRVPDLDSSQLLPVVDKLDRELDTVRKKHPRSEERRVGKECRCGGLADRHEKSLINAQIAVQSAC